MGELRRHPLHCRAFPIKRHERTYTLTGKLSLPPSTRLQACIDDVNHPFTRGDDLSLETTTATCTTGRTTICKILKTSLVNRSPTDSGIRLGRTLMHDATLLVGPQWAWDIGRRRRNNQVIIPMSYHHWQKVFHWRNRHHQQQHLEPMTAPHQLQAADRRQRPLARAQWNLAELDQARYQHAQHVQEMRPTSMSWTHLDGSGHPECSATWTRTIVTAPTTCPCCKPSKVYSTPRGVQEGNVTLLAVRKLRTKIMLYV